LSLNKNIKNNRCLSQDNFFITALIVSASLVLVILPLFQKGTFIDGMLYKAVALNYAKGISSFWSMKFTDTSMTFFCEQPPLFFYICGIFYKIFGSVYWGDRMFSVVLLVTFLFFIDKIFKLEKIHSNRFFIWFIFLFYISIPVVFWSYANQIIEPLLCLLIAISVYTYIYYTRSGNFLFLCLFGVSLLLLFLTKGFQSCFIVLLPFLNTLLSQSKKRALFAFFTSTVTLAIGLIWIIKIYPPAVEWFDCYYGSRLVLTFNNTGSTTDNHFEIIFRFFSELILSLFLFICLCVFIKYKRNYPLKFMLDNFLANKLALALLFCSFAGSFPFALSLVQRGFYLLPAFVCFTLAILLGFKRYWLVFLENLRQATQKKALKYFSWLILVGSFLYIILNIGGYKRDDTLIRDSEKILKHVPMGDTILIDAGLWNYFSLHAMMYMGKQVSLSDVPNQQKYMIRSKNDVVPADYTNYSKVKIVTEELELWEKNGL
jgi:4-amino-4-deoxy-L-arabinose transferase-like glycosyltransferase